LNEIYRGSPPHYRPSEFVTSPTRIFIMIHPDLSVFNNKRYALLSVAFALASARQGEERGWGLGTGSVGSTQNTEFFLMLPGASG
jgi:hypothetical protein